MALKSLTIEHQQLPGKVEGETMVIAGSLPHAVMCFAALKDLRTPHTIMAIVPGDPPSGLLKFPAAAVERLAEKLNQQSEQDKKVLFQKHEKGLRLGGTGYSVAAMMAVLEAEKISYRPQADKKKGIKGIFIENMELASQVIKAWEEKYKLISPGVATEMRVELGLEAPTPATAVKLSNGITAERLPDGDLILASEDPERVRDCLHSRNISYMADGLYRETRIGRKGTQEVVKKLKEGSIITDTDAEKLRNLLTLPIQRLEIYAPKVLLGKTIFEKDPKGNVWVEFKGEDVDSEARSQLPYLQSAETKEGGKALNGKPCIRYRLSNPKEQVTQLLRAHIASYLFLPEDAKDLEVFIGIENATPAATTTARRTQGFGYGGR